MHPTTVRKWSLIVLAFGCTTLLVGGVWASSRILLQRLKISHQISPHVTNRTTALRVVGLESVGSRIKITLQNQSNRTVFGYSVVTGDGCVTEFTTLEPGNTKTESISVGELES